MAAAPDAVSPDGRMRLRAEVGAAVAELKHFPSEIGIPAQNTENGEDFSNECTDAGFKRLIPGV